MRTLQVSTQRSLPERFAWHLLAAVPMVVLSRCATVDTAVVAKPGVEFSLPVGQSATLSGTGYRITFDRVTEDSRCPVDAVCVWAGDAKIQLTISRSTAPAEIRIAGLTPPNSEVVSDNLKIRFVALSPAPRTTEPATSRAYIAQLIVVSP
ncbi:MAG TPA: hypothetical protein VJ840_08325 [Gemmatimonadaceae bacterium]|nr:hypothetical protein [Gemmatimonadaceae bacterium]